MRKKNYRYSQIETYKEVLELEHLKRKTLIVGILLALLIGLLFYFLMLDNITPISVYPAIFILGIVLLVNMILSSVDYHQYDNLKIAMYTTVLGVYVVVIYLIFTFETPSIFTALFLAYALTSIYQDYKTMMLSSFMLFFSGIFLIARYPSIFSLVQSDIPQTYMVFIFVIVFVLLLTLSSYILIKRKTFFYDQLATIKESEIRNIDLAEHVEYIKTNKKKNFKEYYKSLQDFSEELSKKIGVDDLFGRRIQMLKELSKKTPFEINEKYSEFDIDEIIKLSRMEFEVNKKLRYLSIKASQAKDIDVSKKEIFSETQFKSFNHFDDSMYTKIISFAVFYTLLKIDKPYLEKLDEETIYDMLENSDYFHKIEPRIIEIYLENSEVFDTIVKDYLEGGW